MTIYPRAEVDIYYRQHAFNEEHVSASEDATGPNRR